MDALDLYQFFAPLFKAHPWAIVVVLAIAVWGAIWKALPTRYRVRIRAIPRIGVRLDAILDAIANAPILTQFLRIVWHGVINNRVKPDRHSAEELAAMFEARVAEEIAKRGAAVAVVVPSAPDASSR